MFAESKLDEKNIESELLNQELEHFRRRKLPLSLCTLA